MQKFFDSLICLFKRVHPRILCKRGQGPAQCGQNNLSCKAKENFLAACRDPEVCFCGEFENVYLKVAKVTFGSALPQSKGVLSNGVFTVCLHVLLVL